MNSNAYDTADSMKKVISHLELKGVELSKLKILDFYAKDCSWQTKELLKYNKTISLWEIDSQYENILASLVGQENVTICDSYENAKLINSSYDFIILDNPLNVHGSHCEHFDAIPLLKHLAKEKFFVMFNVKLKPYDYDAVSNGMWKIMRNQYYEGIDTSNLTLDDVRNFYYKKFKELKFDVIELESFKRPHEEDLYSIFIEARHDIGNKKYL